MLEAEPTCKRQHLQAGVGLRSSEGSRDMQGVRPCWRWVRVPPPPLETAGSSTDAAPLLQAPAAAPTGLEAYSDH